MYRKIIIGVLFVLPFSLSAQVVDMHQPTKIHFTGATTTSPIYWNASNFWQGEDVSVGSSTQFFVINNTGFYTYCLFGTLVSGTTQGLNTLFVQSWISGVYNTELNLYASSTGSSVDRDSVYGCKSQVLHSGDLLRVSNIVVSGSSWGGGSSVNSFFIYKISSSTTEIFSTTTTIIDNPSQNVYNGLLLFFIGMIFIVWYFRGKLIN